MIPMATDALGRLCGCAFGRVGTVVTRSVAGAGGGSEGAITATAAPHCVQNFASDVSREPQFVQNIASPSSASRVGGTGRLATVEQTPHYDTHFVNWPSP